MLSNSNFRGIFCMLLSGLNFVACDSFLKLLVRDVPPMEALVLRGISATIMCFLAAVVMGHARHLPNAFKFWTLMRTLAEVIAVLAFIVALAKVPLGDITAIYQTAPLIVLAGASFMWGERVGLLRWCLISLGLIGALLIAQPGGQGASPFALLGFITAVASAGRDLLSRKTAADVPGIVVTFSIVVGVFAVACLGTVLFETWVPVTPQLMLYGLASGVFVIMGQLFVFLAFRYATARSVAPFYYSFTLFAVTSGVVFFHEWPNSLAMIGIGLIIACGLAVLAFERGSRFA